MNYKVEEYEHTDGEIYGLEVELHITTDSAYTHATYHGHGVYTDHETTFHYPENVEDVESVTRYEHDGTETEITDQAKMMEIANAWFEKFGEDVELPEPDYEP